MAKRILFSLIFLLILGTACKNPFSLRKSERPTTKPGKWEVPTTPQEAINNLARAYRDESLVNFTNCLDKSFTFSAPEESLHSPSLFYNWDKTKEVEVTRGIFSQVIPNSLSIFLSLEEDTLLSDEVYTEEATLYRRYYLVVEGSASASLSNPAYGLACFRLILGDDDLWRLSFWRDEPLERGKAKSWAALKIELGW